MSEGNRVDQLLEAIHQARARVYQIGKATPLESMFIEGVNQSIWVKREDLGPIKAYKWRGAFNAMACLTPAQLEGGVVAASAGNHAQGIALAARKLGTKAYIFMPKPTPLVKRQAVMAHGGDCVSIELTGDSFSEAQTVALEHATQNGATFIPPYDSIDVMAGQGTLADEIFTSGEGPFDRVYVAIGGGGMASAVAALLKSSWPKVKVIGVEGVDQASMKAAIELGKPVPLDYVDVFCDGTAVTQVGKLTYEFCRDLLDEIVTVTNWEVSSAIKSHWDGLRAIPEPSGAMSLAGFLKHHEAGKIEPDEKILTILCGANMDFAKFADVSRQAGINAQRDQSWRFNIPEEKGSLAGLLTGLPTGVSIMDLQYGRTMNEPQRPLLSINVPDPACAEFKKWITRNEESAEDVTGHGATRFRVIPFTPALFTSPLFVEVEFPERAGALLGFMNAISWITSVCYFNYAYTGERVGRALIGLDFENDEELSIHRDKIFGQAGKTVRAVKEVLAGELF
nr:pyridoxal-phosphate dependent enzyme [bacterium]